MDRFLLTSLGVSPVATTAQHLGRLRVPGQDYGLVINVNTGCALNLPVPPALLARGAGYPSEMVPART
jgi:hypothetical protein